MPKFWLMKAEPLPRLVKGRDVKFSVDDFEKEHTTQWEGVRSHEARNLMQAMKLEDEILFYHSNCKTPGVAGFAEVSKEAYPDHSAWDSSHPYYDPKTDKDAPKWFMVDLTFKSRAANQVPLALFKWLGSLPGAEPPQELQYIGREGLQAIKTMDLVVRGRLSVQRVSEDAFNAVKLLAEKGGWDALDFAKPSKQASKAKVKKPPVRSNERASSKNSDEAGGESSLTEEEDDEPKPTPVAGSKRKRTNPPAENSSNTQDSRPKTRSRRK